MSQTSKVLLAFTGVFVAGAVAGGIVALRVGTEKANTTEQISNSGPRPPATKPAVTVVTPDTFPLRQLDQFKARLGLTPAQGEEIKPIVTLTGKKLQELSQENAAATNALLEEMYKQVGLVLTDAQKKSLAEMQRSRQTQFNNRGNNRRGGPGSTGDNNRPGGNSNTPTFSSPAGAVGVGGPQRMGNRRGGPSGSPSATNSSPQPSPSSAPAPADQPAAQ